MVKKNNQLHQNSTFKKISFRRIFWFFKNIPYKFMFILILLSLWLGEWYPISNFPMYSNFGNSTYFVYITDSQDKPIPLKLEFGFHAAFLKKAYNSRLKKFSDRENIKQNINKQVKAGEELLQYIVSEINPKVNNYTEYQKLKLWKVIISIKNGQIVKKRKLIAELELL